MKKRKFKPGDKVIVKTLKAILKVKGTLKSFTGNEKILLLSSDGLCFLAEMETRCGESFIIQDWSVEESRYKLMKESTSLDKRIKRRAIGHIWHETWLELDKKPKGVTWEKFIMGE